MNVWLGMLLADSEKSGEVCSQIVTAAVSVILSAVVSWFVCRATLRAQAETVLRTRISELIQISIQHPELEDDDFCKGWKSSKDNPSEKYMRYDNYCCLVFNLLEGLFVFGHGNLKKMEELFGAEEMIVRHQNWWISERSQNIKGYRDSRFRGLIQSHIKDHKKGVS